MPSYGDSSESIMAYPLSLSMDKLKDMSCQSMFGLPETTPSPSTPDSRDSSSPQQHSLTTVACVVEAIDRVFSPSAGMTWTEKKGAFYDILNRVHFDDNEISKYILFDKSYPYTRNLIATDNENYTLILLCWSAGRESKIHDHPCQGCFVRTISGRIQENTYSMHKDTDEILPMAENIYGPGLVSYMHDSIGLHKIGNPHPSEGAISLHLYVPPFKKCKVWSEAGKLSSFEEGRMGYYSEYGIRVSKEESESLMYYL